MSRSDDHVIPYEEAVRRRKALEEAQRHTGTMREVKISDAMSHLLEEATTPEHEGEAASPAHLREIVEREFAGEEPDGSTAAREARDASASPSRERDEHGPPRH